ncbi:HNH endonuclease [Haloarchaeobius amylolyticus]|uniref:HNH endonuclease n=1 Tax=Haloarchaeobius amylolyticus TaxID=1198296 RepID=UPI0022721CC0|nr:HNH endonuclease [Haloarchaeobius amylolyticus]
MDCPTCGRSLATEAGMRQHHTKVHGDPLPNRDCSGCGERFYDPKSRREFCDDCNPNLGAHNGNWRDAREEAACVLCGTTFEYYPSEKEGVYCSECVAEAPGLLPENPMDDVEPTVVSCERCDDSVRVPPSRTTGKSYGTFCSVACYGDWLSENVAGEAHHQWEGGALVYGAGWWRVRQQALERDEYTCQRCGTDADDLGQNPDVHHIDPVRSFDDPTDAHSLENVVTLCRPCHRRVEDGVVAVPGPSDEK